MRRLERQVLALPGQHGLEFRQRRAGAYRYHQFARLVTDDALERACIQDFALQGLAVKVFAAAAANTQGRGAGRRGAYPVYQVSKGRVHGIDANAASPGRIEFLELQVPRKFSRERN